MAERDVLRKKLNAQAVDADNPYIASTVSGDVLRRSRGYGVAPGDASLSDTSWLNKTATSVAQRQAGLPDLVMAAGNFVAGDREGAKRRLGSYMENEEFATSIGPEVQDIGQVEDASGAASFVGYTVAGMIPDAVAALTGAGLAGSATKYALKRAAEKQIAGRLLAKEGAGLAAERTALKTAQASATPAFQAADDAGKAAFLKGAGMQAREEVGKEIGTRAAAIAARKGQNGLVTGTAAVAGSALGGTPSQLKEQAGFMQEHADTLTAEQMGTLIGGAAVAASTDYLPFARLAGRFGDDVVNAAVKRNKFMKRFTKETAEQFAAEGSQEAGQAFIIKASQSFVDENVELFDHDARMEYLTNFLAGGIIGGTLGGAGEVGRTGARKISELFNPDTMAKARAASAGAFKAGKAQWQKTVQGVKAVAESVGSPTSSPENAAAAVKASGRTLNPIAQGLSIMPGSGAAEQIEASHRLDTDALTLMQHADDYFDGKSNAIFESAHNLDGYYGDPIADTLGGVVLRGFSRRVSNAPNSTVEDPVFRDKGTKTALLSLAKIMREGQNGANITQADTDAVGALRAKLPDPNVIDDLIGLRSTHPSFTADVEAALEARTRDDTGSGDREATVADLQPDAPVRAGVRGDVDSDEALGDNPLTGEGMLGNKGVSNIRNENSPADLVAGEFRAERVHRAGVQPPAGNSAERLRLTVEGIAADAAKESATPQAKDLAQRVGVLYGVATNAKHPQQAEAARLLAQVIERHAPPAGPAKLPETPDRRAESVEKLKSASEALKKTLHASTNFFRKSKSPKSEAEFNARLSDQKVRASYVRLKDEPDRLFDLGSVVRNYRDRADVGPGENPALGALTAIMMDPELRKQLDTDSIRWGEAINFNDGTHVMLPTREQVTAARLSKRKAGSLPKQPHSPAAKRTGVALNSDRYIRPTQRMSAEEVDSDFESDAPNDDETQQFKLEAKDKPGTINQLDGSDPVAKPADDKAPRRAVAVSGKHQAAVTAMRTEYRQGRALAKALQRVAEALGVNAADINGVTPANNAKATDVIVWVAQGEGKTDKPMQVRKSNMPEILLAPPKAFRNSKTGMFRRGTNEIVTGPEKLYAYAREYLITEAENTGRSERALALLVKELNHADAKPKLDALIVDMANGNRDSQGPRVREAAPDKNEAAKAGLRDTDEPAPHSARTQRALDAAATELRAKQTAREKKAAANSTKLRIVDTEDGDVNGMRAGKNNLSNTAPNMPGWLGNPFVANDVDPKSPYSRAQAVAAYKELFLARVKNDEAFRNAILALRGKSVGYYKPREADIHLHVIRDWLGGTNGMDVPESKRQARIAIAKRKRGGGAAVARFNRLRETPKAAPVAIGAVENDKPERFSRLETRVDRLLGKLKIDADTMRDTLRAAYETASGRVLNPPTADGRLFTVHGDPKVTAALKAWAVSLNKIEFTAIKDQRALIADLEEYAVRLLNKPEGELASALNPARAERVDAPVNSAGITATVHPDRGLQLTNRERKARMSALSNAQDLRDKPGEKRPTVSRIETAAEAPKSGARIRAQERRIAKNDVVRAANKKTREERVAARMAKAGLRRTDLKLDTLPNTTRPNDRAPGPVTRIETDDPKLKASIAAAWKQKPLTSAEHKANVAKFVRSLTSLVGAKSAQALIKTGVVSFVTRDNLPPFAKQVHPGVQAFEYDGSIYVLADTDAGNASGILLHESLHAFGKQALGKDWAPLMAELSKLAGLDAPAPRGDTVAASQFSRQLGVPSNETNMFETAAAQLSKDELAEIKNSSARPKAKLMDVYESATQKLIKDAFMFDGYWAQSIKLASDVAANWLVTQDLTYGLESSRAGFVAAYVVHKSLGNYKNTEAEPRPVSAVAVADAITLLNEQPGLSIVNAYNQAANAAYHAFVAHTDSTGGVWRKHERTDDKTDHKEVALRRASVQTNSANGWCIKYEEYAAKYLDFGDIWTYNNADGSPFVAIRYEGYDIGEIQGPQNDRSLTDAQQQVVAELVGTGKISAHAIKEYVERIHSDHKFELLAQAVGVTSESIRQNALAAKHRYAIFTGIEHIAALFSNLAYESTDAEDSVNSYQYICNHMYTLRVAAEEIATIYNRTTDSAVYGTLDVSAVNYYSAAARTAHNREEFIAQGNKLIASAAKSLQSFFAAINADSEKRYGTVPPASKVIVDYTAPSYKGPSDEDAEAWVADGGAILHNANGEAVYVFDFIDVPFSVKASATDGDWIAQGKERVNAASVKSGMQAEEFAAYAIENYEAAPASIKRWVDTFLAKLKVAVAKLLRKLDVAAELRVSMLKDPAVLREIALQGLKAAGQRAQNAAPNTARSTPAVEASSGDTWRPVGGMDVPTATAAVREAIGADTFKVLNDAGLLSVVSIDEAVRISGDKDNEYRAFVTGRDGRIYIIGERVVESRDMNGLVAHEAIHGLVQHLIGKQEFERVMTHIAEKAMSAQTKAGNWKFGPLFLVSKLVYNEAYVKAGTNKPVHGQRFDEIAAYGVQSFADLPASVRKNIRILIGKLRVALHRMLNKLGIAPAIRAALLDDDAALYVLASQSIEHAANLTLNGQNVAEMAATNPLDLDRFIALDAVAATNAVASAFEASVAPKIAAGVARAAAWVAGRATSSGPAAAGGRAANRIPGGSKPFTDKQAFSDFINVALNAAQRKALYDYAHSGVAGEMFRKLEAFNTVAPGTTRTVMSEMLDPDTGVDASVFYLYQAYLNGILAAYEQNHKDLTGASKDIRAFEDKAKAFMGVYTGTDVAEKMLKDLTTGVTKGYAKRGMPYRPEHKFQRNLKPIGKLKAKLDSSTESIRQAVKDILFNDWDRLYDSGVPALVELGNMIQVRSGLRLDTTKDMPDRGYLPAVEHIRSWWLKKLSDKYDHLSPESRQKVLKELYRQAAAPREGKLNAEETEAFNNIRALYRKAAQYAVTHGILEKDQVRENYMAILFNLGGDIALNKYALVKLISQMDGKAYKYGSMLEGISEIAANRTDGAKVFSRMNDVEKTAFINDVANRAFFDANDVLIDNQLGSQFKAANKRIFQDIFDRGDQRDIDQLVALLEPSLEQHGVRYFEPLVARAEWARRGGDKKVQTLLDKARGQGASEKLLTAAKRMADAAQLKYDFPFIDGVRKGSPTIALFNESLAMKMHNRKVLTAMQNIGAYQNLRLLPLALLSSLVDPQGMMIRNGGNAGETFSAIKVGLQGLWNADTKAALIAAAQEVGYFADLHAAQTLHSGFGVGNETPLARTVNSAVFKYNGLEAWTRQTRLMAIQAGHAFLVRIQDAARGPAGKAKDDALRYLEELGLRVDDVRRGEVQAGPLQGRPYAMILTQQQFDVANKEERFRNARVKAALVQFADEAMLRPNNMQTPTYFKDPYVRLITQYKAFSYAIYEQITRRFLLELSHGNYKVLTAALTYLPVVAFAELIREFIQWGPDGNPNRAEWGPQEYTQQWVSKTGLLGPQAELFGSMYGDAKRNNVPGSSALGPTFNQADQVIDTARGQRDWGTTARKALPGAAIHSNWGASEEPTLRRQVPAS